MTVLEWFRKHKSTHGYKMTALYKQAGISKQGHYKNVLNMTKQESVTREVLASAEAIRRTHKKLGCRKLYHLINPQGIGRDKTEALLLSHGFRVKPKRNYRRTTIASKHRYPNLITGMKLSDINQLWVSDITYIPVGYGKHYYLTLIQDVYSRKITGWELSCDMRCEQTVIPAYLMAIKGISTTQRKGLIFHSDRGSQYISKEFVKMHAYYQVTPSMGGKAWENAHAESINGILKNEYIDFNSSNITLKQAKIMMQSITKKYNEKRPHGSLKNMTPVEFETFVQKLTSEQKPIFKINY